MKKSALRFLVTLLALGIALSSLTGAALAASVYAADGKSCICGQPGPSGTLREGATAECLGMRFGDSRGATCHRVSHRGTADQASSKHTCLD